MAEIRLSKLTKQFSIGLARLVDFLNEKGANVEMNPNAKVSDEYLPAIEAKFGEDQKLKEDSEKVTIKLKEIIEMGSKKKAEPEEFIPEREVVIKTNTLNAEPVHEAPAPVAQPEPEPAPAPAPTPEPAPEPVKETPQEDTGIKVIDKIDLSQFDRKPAKKETPAPVEEQPVAVEPVAEPEPAVEEPAPAVEEAAPQQPANEPREMKVEVERLAGPKVVDKIDLSQFDKKKKKKKRERIDKGGSQKVDVTKVEADPKPKKDNKGGKPGAPAPQQGQGKKNDNKKSRRDRGGDKFKPMTEQEQEEMQKEIQKKI